MKQKEYFQAMDSVTISREALQRGLTALRDADSETDSENGLHLISTEENKKQKRKPSVRFTRLVAAAVAVVLVLLTAFGVIKSSYRTAVNELSAQSGGFVLKAGAAELNDDFYVEIGMMKSDGSAYMVSWDDSSLVSDEERENTLRDYESLQMHKWFVFDSLKVVSEDVRRIKNVIFTLHGGYFCYDNTAGDAVELNAVHRESQPVSYRVLEPYPYRGVASGEVNEPGYYRIEDTAYKLFGGFTFMDNTGKYEDWVVETSLTAAEDADEAAFQAYTVDEWKIFRDMFEEHKDEIYMTVTVNFKDGSSGTRKLVFDIVQTESGNPFDSGYRLEAKLAP